MRALFWRLLRWFLFRIDAETAHKLTTSLIRSFICCRKVPLRIVAGRAIAPPSASRRVFGMEFSSPVGLAAGFDKNAEILAALPDLGFGFAEIGTVTPRPQPGNDRPRLFRDPSRSSLFNRMGFNNLGATLVAARLERTKPGLPQNFRVGVNIGKNKDTPLEIAASDYFSAILPFRNLADYVVINVSSPNTPGLRSLQTAEALFPIVDSVAKELVKWVKKPPLLLKLAPELHGETLKEVISSLEGRGIDGWVLTNTLAGRIEASSGTLSGGWSGGAVCENSRRSLQEARSISRLPIISVGGIMSAEEAKLRVELGADLVQIYTGWIYEGPEFPGKIAKFLKN